MRIEFADAGLARICTDEAHRMSLPFAVIKMARNRLLQMEAAADEKDLRELKGLRYKKLMGNREGQRSIRVNDQYRIVFTITDGAKPVILITDIGDMH